MSENIDLNNVVVLSETGRSIGKKVVVLGEANEARVLLESGVVAQEKEMDGLSSKESAGRDNGSRHERVSREVETGKEEVEAGPGMGNETGKEGVEVGLGMGNGTGKENAKEDSLGFENCVGDSGAKLDEASRGAVKGRGVTAEVGGKAVGDSGAKIDETIESEMVKEDFAVEGKGVSPPEAEKDKKESAELEHTKLGETSCARSVESEKGKEDFVEKEKEVSPEADKNVRDSAELERQAVEDSGVKTRCSPGLELEKENVDFAEKDKEVSLEAETDKKGYAELERKAVADAEAKLDETSCAHSLEPLPCVLEDSKPKSLEAIESSMEVDPDESAPKSKSSDGSEKPVSLTNGMDSKLEALPCVTTKPESVEATESAKQPHGDVQAVEEESKVDLDETFPASDSKVVGGGETVDSGRSQNGTTEVHLEAQPKSGQKKGVGKSDSRRVKSNSVPSKPSFKVGDLIWGKVRSHPWWPGQIYDPSAASKKAKKYFKKDAYLIAYYGDNTFAWNEASQVKPFLEHFHQMVKLSNTEEFRLAIDCALDEVSRRLEFGLACSCLSEEVYLEIESQVIDNTGIREEESRRDGGDRAFTADLFKPVSLVEYIKELARGPNEAANEKLDFTLAQSELLSFARWKGYTQLPEFTIVGTILEMDAEVSLPREEKRNDDVVPEEKGKSELENSSSAKRKVDSKVGVSPSKKKKSSADSMVEKKQRVEAPVVEKKRVETPVIEKKREKTRKAENGSKGKPGRKKRKATGSEDDVSPDLPEKEVKIAATEVENKPILTKQSFRVGDRISKVASQLNSSSPILKNGNEKSKSPQPQSNSKEEALSEESKQRKPEKENSPSLDQSGSDDEDKQSLEDLFGGKTGKKSNKRGRKSSRAGATELPNRLGPTTESYWSERIGKSVPEDEDEAGETEPEIEADSKKKLSSENPDVDCLEESSKDGSFATALVVKFPGSDSVPSKTDLNKIFSSYGSFDGSKTEFLKNNCVKVIFRNRDDAEEAFSSAGKAETFKRSPVSYHLKYISSSSPKKSSSNAKKRSKKNRGAPEENSS